MSSLKHQIEDRPVKQMKPNTMASVLDNEEEATNSCETRKYHPRLAGQRPRPLSDDE